MEGTAEHVVVEKAPEVVQKAPEPQAKEFDPSTFEIKTREDFDVYNAWVRKTGRLQGYKIKVPTEEYYKKVKVKFQRFDQPENVLKARVRNKDIDWKGQLKPGGTYYLPMPVITWLNGLCTPIYKEVDVNDGGETVKETRQVGEISRFSCQILEFAA